MPPLREIDEIAQLHAREGSRLQEVFVEGREDKYFYETFLAENGLGQVAVLDIGTVNVPDSDVLKLGLNVGNKGRIIALAAALEGRVTQQQIACIADGDTDHLKETSYNYTLLLLTDYTSIELYVLCPVVLERVLTVALGGFPKGHLQVTTELAELLQDAFLVRVAAEDLKLAPTFPTHHSFCSLKKGKPSFDLVNYINKAFEAYSDKSWRAPLNARILARRAHLSSDPRLQMHGHDLLATFSWYVRQHPKFGHINPETFSGVLLGFADGATLSNEPLFRELLRRLRRA